jgi:hypothetical protein
MSPRSIRCAVLNEIDCIVSSPVRLWRRRTFRESGTSHWLIAPLTSGERFMVGAFRFWKWCRMTSRPALPSLHQRLAPTGGAMLAVPLHDYFRLISDLCACTRHAGVAGTRTLGSDEVVLLTLLHAGTACGSRPESAPPGDALLPLLLVAGWAVRRQLVAELNLRLMSAEDHRERALVLWKPAGTLLPGPASGGRASQTLN